MRNLSSRQAKWRKADPMAEFDLLPAPLRGWLRGAALPWSARSARRVWDKALLETGCEQQALARLTKAERQTLAKEV